MKCIRHRILISLMLTLPVIAAHAQSGNSGDQRPEGASAPSSQGPVRASQEDFSSGSSQSGTAQSGQRVTTEGGNSALNSNVRGEGATTSDRETSRNWTGVGSTGGATGTGESTGTSNASPSTNSGMSGANGGGTGSESSSGTSSSGASLDNGKR